MDFLTLCQRLRQETGISDSGLSQVTGQTGDMKRLVDWINDSWLRIQSSRQDWGWMFTVSTLTATQGSNQITLPSDVEVISDLALAGSVLVELKYDTYKANYRSLQSGTPTAYTIRPDGVLLLNAIPESNLQLDVEYYIRPVSMVSNIDVPAMPAKYHMLIVWGGLRDYALFDEAPELGQKAALHYEQMYAELTRDQAPPVLLAETIA